jgi:hypothetical protein
LKSLRACTLCSMIEDKTFSIGCTRIFIVARVDTFSNI